jgi:dTDP-4-amino-4,6-dideoxygalactose transaminase
MKKIEFIDLKSQYNRVEKGVLEGIKRVLDHGGYILGPEVKTLEKQLEAFCGAKHALSCANGTDAIGLALMAKDLKREDAVFVPSFTFAATAEVVAWFDATAIFVDVDTHTFNMDPIHLEASILEAKKKGLNPVGIIPVDLFGQPADYVKINAIAKQHGLWVIGDAAQSFGATLHGQGVGTLAEITTTSFFPAKPLGCYGDGGAVFTNDAALLKIMESCRVHGKGDHKYDNVRIGMNGRLDTVQAAVLIEKLAIFGDELKARDRVAQKYNAAFKGKFQIPELIDGATSAWAQYTLVSERRDEIMKKLEEKKVPSVIYYPKPLNQQPAYDHYPTGPGGVPVSEQLARTVFSLPMHPYMDDETQDYIIQAVLAA